MKPVDTDYELDFECLQELINISNQRSAGFFISSRPVNITNPRPYYTVCSEMLSPYFYEYGEDLNACLKNIIKKIHEGIKNIDMQSEVRKKCKEAGCGHPGE